MHTAPKAASCMRDETTAAHRSAADRIEASYADCDLASVSKLQEARFMTILDVWESLEWSDVNV